VAMNPEKTRVCIKKTPFFLQKKLTAALHELQGRVKWMRRSHHLVVTYSHLQMMRKNLQICTICNSFIS
jgi:hypothetical protein